MLSLLHIENIAIIESADISFDRGFNVLTGETGAGKSIVIDAISAVLGERTSREVIRTGAKSALVNAVFTGEVPLKWLEDNGFPADGEELMLQREIQGDGRNICRVNGRPLTVAQLRELGRQLLNIHGQHDGQQLLDPDCHLGYLDSFGKTASLLESYQSAYRSMASLRRRISELEMDEAERSRRETLEFQIRELERAELKPGEDEELDARKTLLRSSGKLMEAIQEAQFALAGGEDSQGACDLISEAEGAIRSVTRLSPQLEELGEKLTALRYAADDASEVIRDFSEAFDFSPEELDQLESRLDVIYRLKKKYGPTVTDMLDYLERSKEELEQIQEADDTIQRLEKELEQARKETVKRGTALTKARRKAADNLQKRVQEELRQLDMPKVQFVTDFAPCPGQDGMDDTGMDQIQFLMSANLGEALKPIQKVASGGELARIMLALKNVLAEDDGIGSLVFDEVDTGDVALRKQVLCVTHLPQIAAMADTHFSVEKGEKKGRTFTNVVRLGQEGRVEELARLIGGAAVTDVLKQSATELLEQAEGYKAT